MQNSRNSKNISSGRGFKRKGNAEYQSRQLWNELSQPQQTRDFMYPGIFTLPENVLRHGKRIKPNAKYKAKYGVSSMYKHINIDLQLLFLIA